MKAAKAEPAPILEAGRIVEIPVSMLMPDPKQPRTEFNEDDLRAFGEELKVRVRVPLSVRSDYVIEDGERRWRAAKLVKLESLPCMLAAPAAEDKPDLERLLGQAAVNDQREPLSVLDWARLLRRLHEEHAIPVKDLPELLESRGFKKLSRPYISNLMRLDDLPDWAQELLRAGHITPSDGKHLLMARPHPPAMQWLEKELKLELKGCKEGEILREAMATNFDKIEDYVERAYDETAIALTRTYGDKQPLFKWKNECKTCSKRQAIDNSEYCLDEKCFNQKQTAARAKLKESGKTEEQGQREARSASKPKKPMAPTKVTPNDQGVVNASKLSSEKYRSLQGYGLRFEPAMHCEGCEHNHPAIEHKSGTPEPTCFNVACFEEKQRNGNREEGIAQWLDKRLLPLVQARLAGNYDLQFQLLAWMALGGHTQTNDEFSVKSKLHSEQARACGKLNLHHPGAVIQAYTDGSLNGEAIAQAGVRALLADRAQFYAFARYLGIRITPEIASLDAEYIEIKRKGEIIALLAGHTVTEDISAKGDGSVTSTLARDAEALGKRKLDDLKTLAQRPDVVRAIGVPPDVQALYDHLKPVLEELDELDRDDEVSGETEGEVAGEEA